MEFRLLGPLEVAENGRTLPIGGPKQRVVLAHLVLRANAVVSLDRLIDAIWGDRPPLTARNTVQTYIRHLRTALGADRLVHRSPGYLLVAGPSEIDLGQFNERLDRARDLVAGDAEEAAALFREALGLWRGPALDDLASHASLQTEIVRLEGLRMSAVEEGIAAELALDRHATLIPELESLVDSNPSRERLLAHLMTALYRAGRQADALAAFRRTADRLRDELGISPSPDLQALHQRILRQDRDLDLSGQVRRGYRLLEPLGEGSFGTVHRAFQPQVGREVAVKTVHPRFANSPEFIRRFEAEAQLVARLEHPHVVALYDFWRQAGAAFLVMRYLRGGSLRARLATGPLPLEDSARMVDQLALALDSAHRQGVIHRDVKPGNVLFDEDGNAYLADFGIARDLATAEARASGGSSPTVRYLSPEEILGEEPTARTDVYGLGVLLHESLAGQHPSVEPAPSAIPLPPSVTQVIACATAADPADRYPDAPALASALRQALATGPEPVLTAAARNPYKGLRPFEEADALDFFGRDRLVARLVAGLAADRFLAVVGPSGSGKSSLVAAGLIPALRAGAGPGSERWFVAQLRPGDQVLDELAAALLRLAPAPVPDLRGWLDAEDGIGRAARAVLPADGELLLVVDQFEEVFTLVADEAVRVGLLSALAAAAGDPASRVRVVVTLRADFYDRPLGYPGFGDLLAARTEAITPLTVEELERAVRGPAEGVGVRVGPSLLAAIVAEVADQPGTMPLLQYALTELFDQRDGDELTVERYRDLGRISGALTRAAEELYAREDAAGQRAIQQLLLRLIALGEEGSADTRRRVSRTELSALDIDPSTMDAVIEAFGARRLLSFGRDPVTRGPTVEVAHEALLREWTRLRGWVEVARDDLRAQRRLAVAAVEWVEAGRDPSTLLRGDNLDRFEAWSATSGVAMTAGERGYLGASLAQRTAEHTAEEVRLAREATLERRSVLWLRSLVAVFAALAIVAAGLTGLTLVQRDRAERQARLATARELAAASVSNLDVDPERSVLLAIEAVAVTRDADGTVVREAEEALHRAMVRSRLVRAVPQGGRVAASPDGTSFATTGEDGNPTLWTVDGGQSVRTLAGHDGPVSDAAFSPDGRRLVTTGEDGTVRVWDVASGTQLALLRGHEGAVWRVDVSPDGRLAATTGVDGTARVWDLAAGTQIRQLKGWDPQRYGIGVPVSPAFSPDGTRLASPRGDGTATIYDVATGRVITELIGHEWPVTDVVFGPDGHVVTASLDGTAKVWDAASGAPLLSLPADKAEVYAVDVSSDGTRIATAGSDATVRVWDARSGERLLSLAGHTSEVDGVRFGPAGDRLLTSSVDGTTRLWDVGVTGGREWVTVAGPLSRYAFVALSPDAATFAVPGDVAGVTIRDVATGAVRRVLQGSDATLGVVAFSPDGRRLAGTAGTGATRRAANRTVPIWDTATGALVMTLVGHTDEVSAAVYRPDGKRLVTSSWDGTLREWDVATGAELRAITVGVDAYALSYSPDGRYLVAGVGDTPRVWNADTFEPVAELHGHTRDIQAVAFAPDGRLVTAGFDGTARVWDLSTAQTVTTFAGHNGTVMNVAFSPDGTTVATAGADATVRLWNPTTGQEVLTLFAHEKAVDSVVFSSDGRFLLTASVDGTVMLHLLRVDELVRVAASRVSRSFTDDECRRFLHRDACRV